MLILKIMMKKRGMFLLLMNHITRSHYRISLVSISSLFCSSLHIDMEQLFGILDFLLLGITLENPYHHPVEKENIFLQENANQRMKEQIARITNQNSNNSSILQQQRKEVLLLLNPLKYNNPNHNNNNKRD